MLYEKANAMSNNAITMSAISSHFDLVLLSEKIMIYSTYYQVRRCAQMSIATTQRGESPYPSVSTI